MPTSPDPQLCFPTCPATKTAERQNSAAEQVAELVKQAETAVQETNFERVRGLLSMALQIFPDQPDLRIGRGFASFQLKDYEAAHDDFAAVVARNPEAEPGHINLAVVLLQIGRVDEALRALREGLRLHPRNLELARILANQLFRNQQWADAAIHFGTVIAQAPNDIPTLLAIAKCFFELKDLQTCLRTYECVLQIDPANEVAKHNLGLLCSEGFFHSNPVPACEDDKPALSVAENTALNVSEMKSGACRLESTPRYLEIASTNVCNILPPCVHCWKHIDPGHGYLRRDARHISKRILTALRPAVRRCQGVSLHGIGEPLTCNYLFEVAEDATSDTAITFVSNGWLLNEANIQKILSHGVKFIDFSLDAASPELYRKIRHGDFQKVVSNIRNLISERDRLNLAAPQIRLNMCLMRENVRDIPAFVRLASELGAEGAHIFHMNKGAAYTHEWFNYEDQHCEKDPETHDRYVEEGFALAAKLGVNLVMSGQRSFRDPQRQTVFFNAPVDSNKFFCDKPWTSLLVMTSGDVFNCCWQSRPVGSLQSASPRQVWNNSTLAELRRSTAAGIPHPVCLNKHNRCPYLGRT